MKRALAILALAAALGGCPQYERIEKVADQDGLTPPDQYARYGSEQAQSVAIGREYAHFLGDRSPEGMRAAADSIVAFARRMPDVREVQVDTAGGWVSLRFRSGWQTWATPTSDGKRGCETPNLPAGGPCAAARS
jgi:hypothetical protein